MAELRGLRILIWEKVMKLWTWLKVLRIWTSKIRSRDGSVRRTPWSADRTCWLLDIWRPSTSSTTSGARIIIGSIVVNLLNLMIIIIVIHCCIIFWIRRLKSWLKIGRRQDWRLLWRLTVTSSDFAFMFHTSWEDIFTQDILNIFIRYLGNNKIIRKWIRYWRILNFTF